MKKKIFVFVAILMIMLTLVSCGKKYVVTFDTQGGSIIEEVEVKKGKKVSEPIDPTKEGYVFVEWQLDGVKYDFSTRVKKDITLVAKWEIPTVEGKVTVIFDTQSGSKIDSVTINKGTKVSEPASPVKEGSVFAGWQLNGVEFNFDTKLDQNITLVAVWKTALTTPKNVKFSNNKVTWDKVNGATSYDVYVNGVKKESNVNEYAVDLAKEGLVSISVAAKSDSGLSEKTETMIYTNPYTVSEIADALGMTEEYANMYLDEFRMVLGAQVKFGVTFNELDEMEDPAELLQYIQNGKTSNLVSFFGIMYGVQFQTSEYSAPEMPDVDLQALFDDMKQKGAYVSNKTNYADDERFVELVVPYVGYAMSFCRYYDEPTIFNVLQELISLSHGTYEVIRDNETYTFTKYDGKEYVLKASELVSLINYYNVINYNNKVSSSSLNNAYKCEMEMYQYMYEVFAYERITNVQEDAKESVAKIIANFEKNKDALNATAIKLYDAYETAMTYQTKLDELMSMFEQIDSEAKLTAFIEDARNFAIQVAELIEDNLPTESEVMLLVETLEGYGYLLGTSSDLDAMYYTFEALLNTAITTVNTTLSLIDEITVNDIESLLVLMENPEDAEAIETVKKVINLFETKLSNITINGNIDIDSVYKLYSMIFMVNAQDFNTLKSLASILFDIQFTDEQVKELEDELTAFVKYIEAYDTTKLEELLPGLYAGTADEDVVFEELFKAVDYVTGYLTSDKIVKYEKYIKSAILQSGAFDNTRGIEFYEYLKDNCNLFVEYFAYYGKLDLIYEMFGDSSYDKLNALEYAIDFAKSEYTNEEYQALMDLIAKGDQIIDGDVTLDESYKENLFYIDYQGSLVKLEKLVGKTYSELTTEDRQLIYDADFIYWCYPSDSYME